ncbi:MAG: carbohydrate-binding family 9-like protein [Myxococcales bacterium]|nr:carbohydrate-binding family 9-like protein [Myxococcales bacterium]
MIRGTHPGLSLLSLLSLVGCGGWSPPDREIEVAQPFDTAETEGEASFSGVIELTVGRIDGRSVSPAQLRPARLGDEADATSITVDISTTGLAGAEGRLGLLPAAAAARQEVGFGQPGQPDDPRARWIDVKIGEDGEQHFELPGPGEDWHAAWAVIVVELRLGRTGLSAQAGPRSEMLQDGGRHPGGRVVQAAVPVEQRPTRLAVPRVAGDAITLDGRLDEPVWRREAATALLLSRDGEPAESIDAMVGGPTLVWLAWDESQLYVAAALPDRDLYAPHHDRDDPLYRDEAFELFLAGDGSGNRYLEHQVSARGVHFDARFPRYRKGDEAWNGSWRSAVLLDGELERRGGDRGWQVELAFPWAELCAETEIDCPPRVGQLLRGNAFRLEKADRRSQVGLALSPTLAPDFHAWQNAAELVLTEASP